MESAGGSSISRKKSFVVSHSGKFKSKNRKRISIIDETWIGPGETTKPKVYIWKLIVLKIFLKIKFQAATEPQKTIAELATSENENNSHGFSSNLVIADKKLPGDKSKYDTAKSQNKADYKAAEAAYLILDNLD